MKAYQVTENGKPLEEKNIETPSPKGSEVLIKTVRLWSLSFRRSYT
jgi:D-arabinose 1-dehydrogenase-like Zn-dependent alcohol dehydrogenase